MDTIRTRTAGGVEVEITPRLTGSGEPTVRLAFDNPQRGSLWVETSQYREFVPGKDGRIGACGLARQADSGKPIAQVCVQIPREDFDRGMALAGEMAAARRAATEKRQEEKAAAALAACPSGFIPCRQKWSNGDLMSACYVAADGTEVIASDLLEDHSGWYWIPTEDVATARGEDQARKDATSAASAERSGVVAQARVKAAETGSPVEIGRWMDGCDGTADECSADLCVQVVLPDGAIRVDRTHAY